MKISAEEAYTILDQWQSAGKRVLCTSSLLGPASVIEGFIALSRKSVAITTGGLDGVVRLSASLTDTDTNFESIKGKELPSDIKNHCRNLREKAGPWKSHYVC